MNTNNMLPNSIIKNGRRFAKLFLTASFILMVTLSPVVSLTGLMKVKQVFADISEYSISVPATQTLNQNTQISIPGISISGGNAEDELNVILSIPNGEIWIDNQNGVVVQNISDGLIKITGTRDAINTALESLNYGAYDSGSFQMQVRITSDQGEVIGSNGHAYIFVNNNLSWEASRDAAAASTFQGATGYLATITSEEENDIIATKLGSNGWIGTSDDYRYINEATGSEYTEQSETEGKWYWVTGPESGTQVWEGASSGNAVGGNYNNWALSEPNNYEGDENCNEIYSSDGSWNDMPCDYGVGGYIVEYEFPGEGSFATGPTASFTVNVAGLEVQSLSPANNATNIPIDSKLILDFGVTPENYPDGSFGIDSYDSDTAENLYLNIYDSNNNLFDSLNVSDDENAFEIDGNRVTVTPHQNFSPNTTYYVQVDNNMFGFYQCECSRFMWKGISDQVTWKFTTQAPVVVTTSSSSSAGQGAPWTPEVGPVKDSAIPNIDACPADQLLTQNLKAPSRDGKYNSYTKGIVTEVKILQAHLNRLGFNSGKVDGILGPISTGAIKRMQTFLGTKADGYVGPLTRALINNSCGEKGLQKS